MARPDGLPDGSCVCVAAFTLMIVTYMYSIINSLDFTSLFVLFLLLITYIRFYFHNNLDGTTYRLLCVDVPLRNYSLTHVDA